MSGEPAPRPYVEPRAGMRAALRSRALRLTVGGVVLLGLLALADQSILRTTSMPHCLSCGAEFDEVELRIDVPLAGLARTLRTTRTLRRTTAAGELTGTRHTHATFPSSSTTWRGLVVRRMEDATVACGTFQGTPFARSLNEKPEFAAFVRAAIERGDVPRDDIVAAVESLERAFQRDELPPEERRVRDVANRLYAAWRGKPLAETDLWNAHE